MNYCITILIFSEDRLSLKDFCSYLYLPWPHEGPIYPVVLTQLSEDLTWLRCISPCVVPFSARREQSGEKWIKFSSSKVCCQTGFLTQRFTSWPVAAVSAKPICSFELSSTEETPPLRCSDPGANHSFLLKHKRSWCSLTHSLDKVVQALAYSPRGEGPELIPCSNLRIQVYPFYFQKDV